MKISSIKHEIHERIKSLVDTGFFHIFGASTLNRFLAVVLSFVLVRILTKEDYGIYAYAYNIVSFFILFNGLGIPSAILQICSEFYQQSKLADRIYAYAFSAGIRIDIILGALILLCALCVPLEIAGSNQLLALYCLYPLAMLLFDIKAMRLRVLLMNREFALATNIQSVLMTVLTIAGAALFGAIGLIVGQTLSFLLAYRWLCAKYPFRKDKGIRLERKTRRDFWSISLISALNNGLSQMLALTGTFFVGQFLANSMLVASYQVATLIPYGLLFVPSALMTYAYPYFARHSKDRNWTVRNYVKLTVASILIMGVIACLFGLLADPLVLLLFGEQYLDTVLVIRLLLIGFFITAAFRQPAGNLLVTQRRLVTNAMIGIITITANILLSIWLIPLYGMIGAAWVYIFTMATGGALSAFWYVKTILRLR